MRTVKALSVAAGLVAAFVIGGRLYQAQVAGQVTQPPPKPASAPVYVAWPLPATGTAYGTIDGQHLGQYVKEQADIARALPRPRASAVLGEASPARRAMSRPRSGSSKKYQQIGLTDTRIQTGGVLPSAMGARVVGGDGSGRRQNDDTDVGPAALRRHVDRRQGLGSARGVCRARKRGRLCGTGRPWEGRLVHPRAGRLQHRAGRRAEARRRPRRGCHLRFGFSGAANYSVQSYRANDHTSDLQPRHPGCVFRSRSDRRRRRLGDATTHQDPPRRQMGPEPENVPGVGHAAGRDGRNDLRHRAP